MEEPVKNYSSGMYVRLGFAVAVHTDPDVLLVDEVLAVGDEAFAHRCLRRIEEFLASGRDPAAGQPLASTWWRGSATACSGWRTAISGWWGSPAG